VGAFGARATRPVPYQPAVTRARRATRPVILHPSATGLHPVLDMQRTVGNAAVCHLLRARRASPELRVQRKVRYDGEDYEETTMPMAELELLIRRVHREDKVVGTERDELLRVLRKRYEERAKTELVVIPKEGLPSAPTETSSPAPVRPPRKPLPPVPGGQPRKPLPAVPGRSSDAPSTPVPKVVTVSVAPTVKPTPFNTARITDANRGEVLAALEDWWNYADAAERRLSVELAELQRERSSQGDAYYDQSNAAQRARYKDLRSKVAHLGGTKNEVESVRTTIEGSRTELLDDFLLLTRSGRIVAVAEWVDTYIANIAADPRNIIPEEDRQKPGGGVARAVIGITVLKSRRADAKGRGSVITLYALNNKVKGIYAHLGFKVFVDDRHLVERPGKGVKARGATGLLEPYKTEWHVENNMVLPEGQAVRFLAGLTEVVKPPEKLLKYLEAQK
jgi:hypothetical protein